MLCASTASRLWMALLLAPEQRVRVGTSTKEEKVSSHVQSHAPPPRRHPLPPLVNLLPSQIRPERLDRQGMQFLHLLDRVPPLIRTHLPSPSFVGLSQTPCLQKYPNSLRGVNGGFGAPLNHSRSFDLQMIPGAQCLTPATLGGNRSGYGVQVWKERPVLSYLQHARMNYNSIAPESASGLFFPLKP